jgi:hypothetical protein
VKSDVQSQMQVLSGVRNAPLQTNRACLRVPPKAEFRADPRAGGVTTHSKSYTLNAQG